jgi:hypothetical protein
MSTELKQSPLPLQATTDKDTADYEDLVFALVIYSVCIVMNAEEEDPIPLYVKYHPAGTKLPTAGGRRQECKAQRFGAWSQRRWEDDFPAG